MDVTLCPGAFFDEAEHIQTAVFQAMVASTKQLLLYLSVVLENRFSGDPGLHC